MKTKILVTGSNGQLGNELRLLSAHLNHLSFVFTDVTELDITQPEAVNEIMESLQPQYLINCAAYTAIVDKAESEKESAWKINAIAQKYSPIQHVKPVLALFTFPVTMFLMGKIIDLTSLLTPTHPLSWYGKSKG